MDRFWSKVDVRTDDECWEWQAAKQYQGYGIFRFDNGVRLAHRISWLLTNTEIPKGMVVMHKCDNTPCVNPKHLCLGTQKDNIQDMKTKGRGNNQKKTHCPQGHEYSVSNTFYNKKNARVCRVCNVAKAVRFKAKKKALQCV
jgi:hypothetical protein